MQHVTNDHSLQTLASSLEATASYFFHVQGACILHTRDTHLRMSVTRTQAEGTLS